MNTQKKKRMLLIQPTIYDQYNKLVKKNMLYFIGLTMPLLAAECGDDWDVEICIETIEDIPWDTDIDLIGIGSMGHSIIRGIEIAKELSVSKEEIAFSLDAIQDPVSLQEPVYNDGQDSVYVMDQIKDTKNIDRRIDVGCYFEYHFLLFFTSLFV